MRVCAVEQMLGPEPHEGENQNELRCQENERESHGKLFLCDGDVAVKGPENNPANDPRQPAEE